MKALSLLIRDSINKWKSSFASRSEKKVWQAAASKQLSIIYMWTYTLRRCAESSERQKLRVRDVGGEPGHQVRFDKRWMIQRRPYSRSVSELTPPKMKCTLGDPRIDPNTLSLPPVFLPLPPRSITLCQPKAYLREKRVPRVGTYRRLLNIRDLAYKFRHM